MINKNIEQIEKALLLGIRDYFKKNNFKKAVIGLSGGLDSSVSAFLVAKAIGPENLTALLMPETGVTTRINYDDALKLAKKLRIKHHTITINEPINFFSSINDNFSNKKTKSRKDNPEKIKRSELFALANSKARIRMTILYQWAFRENALVIGTSDKSEIALGYTTKYGDNASDILVLGDLWKTEVIELGQHLKLPKNILEKKPSAELLPGVDAEKELGAPYNILDKILKLYLAKELPLNKITNKPFNKKLINSVIKRLRINEHKRRNAVLIRISERSFHNMEWRMPVTNRYLENK